MWSGKGLVCLLVFMFAICGHFITEYLLTFNVMLDIIHILKQTLFFFKKELISLYDGLVLLDKLFLTLYQVGDGLVEGK